MLPVHVYMTGNTEIYTIEESIHTKIAPSRLLHSKPPVSKADFVQFANTYIYDGSARHIGRTRSHFNNAGGAVQSVPEVTINAVGWVIQPLKK